MGEFRRIAEQLSSCLNEAQPEGGITSQQIPEIIGNLLGSVGEEVNCYPGISGCGCRDVAFFVSLCSRNYSKGRGHLSCQKAMEKVVQHLQGSCSGITKFAVFITDSWDTYAFDEWKANLQQIQKNVQLEVYLLTGRSVSPISI